MDKQALQEKRLQLLEMLRLARMVESGVWKNPTALRYAKFWGQAFLVILLATGWYAFKAAESVNSFITMLIVIVCSAGIVSVCAGWTIRRFTLNEPTWDEMIYSAMENYMPLRNEIWQGVYSQADSDGNIPLEVIKVWISEELKEADRLYEEATAKKIKLPRMAGTSHE